jgi:hypothetical protein
MLFDDFRADLKHASATMTELMATRTPNQNVDTLYRFGLQYPLMHNKLVIMELLPDTG